MRRILIGITILVASLIFLYQGLVPSLLWFMDTELAAKLFYVDAPEDNKDRSTLAFEQCKGFAQENFEAGAVIEFHKQDSKIWKVGNNTYIVKSGIEVQNPAEAELPDKYLYICKLRYTGGEETEKTSWALLGFELAKPEAQLGPESLNLHATGPPGPG
jgi:hypothetical protein